MTPPRPPSSLLGAEEHIELDPRRWWILGVLCSSLTLVMVSNSSLNVALPSFARELDASDSQLQWIVDAYALVFAGMLFGAATLGDRFGRKGALQIGLVLFIVAALGGAMANDAGQVIAARAVMGLGAAFVMPSTLSILSNVFPDHERPRAISMWAGISAGAAALGPPTSGFLLEHFWWGSVFLVTLPIAVVALIAGQVLLPSTRDPDATRIDVAGLLMSIVAIVALVYTIIEAPLEGWASTTTIVGFVVSAVAFAVFVAVERRVDHPMLDLRLFRDPRFSVASTGIAFAFFAMFGSFFLITQILQLVHGLSPLQAGLMILPMSAALMIVSPRAAALAARFGVATLVPIGLVVVAAGLLGIGLLAGASSAWMLLLAMVPLAVGMALTASPLTTLIMSSVPRARAGMGSAMNDATRELGGALGVAVIGSVASTVYVRHLPALGGLDAESAAATRSGLAGALEVAGAGVVDGLDALATDAFLDGVMVAAIVASSIALLAAAASRRWLPRQTTERAAAAVPGAAFSGAGGGPERSAPGPGR